MITTKFEDTYTSVYYAKKHTEKLAAVVEFLSKQTEAVTCKEIGTAVFGESYRYRSNIGQIGQILKHLRNGGFLTVEERDGDPVEINFRHWEYIKVAPDGTAEFGYRDEKKTIIPKVKYYKLIG